MTKLLPKLTELTRGIAGQSIQITKVVRADESVRLMFVLVNGTSS